MAPPPALPAHMHPHRHPHLLRCVVFRAAMLCSRRRLRPPQRRHHRRGALRCPALAAVRAERPVLALLTHRQQRRHHAMGPLPHPLRRWACAAPLAPRSRIRPLTQRCCAKVRRRSCALEAVAAAVAVMHRQHMTPMRQHLAAPATAHLRRLACACNQLLRWAVQLRCAAAAVLLQQPTPHHPLALTMLHLPLSRTRDGMSAAAARRQEATGLPPRLRAALAGRAGFAAHRMALLAPALEAAAAHLQTRCSAPVALLVAAWSRHCGPLARAPMTAPQQQQVQAAHPHPHLMRALMRALRLPMQAPWQLRRPSATRCAPCGRRATSWPSAATSPLAVPQMALRVRATRCTQRHLHDTQTRRRAVRLSWMACRPPLLRHAPPPSQQQQQQQRRAMRTWRHSRR
jgi:hypothetical protein